MPAEHSNSMVQRGAGSTSIETGQIINVDTAHWTVDVRTKNTHRQLVDLQMGAPYLHFHSGEGIYAMPEVGALVQVCMPGEGLPFILCFVTAFERETQSGGSSHASEPGAGEAESEVTYRAGRPPLQQGDIMLRTRDGNHLWLRRGGVVEIGAGHMAKRVYIPLTNMIRDVFENYEALSTAGEMMWTTTRADSDPDGEASAVFTIASRNYAQDEHTTVLVQTGHVDEDLRIRCVVAPDAIDSRTGDVTGDAVYEFTVNADGDVDITIAGDVAAEVEGDVELTVSGAGELTFGSLTETVNGDLSQQVSGSHTLRASSSRETLSGTKVIDAPMTQVGGTTPVMLMTGSVIAFMAAHRHDVMGSTTGPPTPSVVPIQMQARKLKGG